MHDISKTKDTLKDAMNIVFKSLSKFEFQDQEMYSRPEILQTIKTAITVSSKYLCLVLLSMFNFTFNIFCLCPTNHNGICKRYLALFDKKLG